MVISFPSSNHMVHRNGDLCAGRMVKSRTYIQEASGDRVDDVKSALRFILKSKQTAKDEYPTPLVKMNSGYLLISPPPSDLEEELPPLPPATLSFQSSKFRKTSQSFQYTALPVPYDAQDSTSSNIQAPGKQQQVVRSKEDIEDHEDFEAGDSEDDNDADSESTLLLAGSLTQSFMYMLGMEPKRREMKTVNRQ
jgi:hypothetical protein